MKQIKEAIELLEKTKDELHSSFFDMKISEERFDGFFVPIDQALALLCTEPKQPLAGEFTKKIRDRWLAEARNHQ